MSKNSKNSVASKEAKNEVRVSPKEIEKIASENEPKTLKPQLSPTERASQAAEKAIAKAAEMQKKAEERAEKAKLQAEKLLENAKKAEEKAKERAAAAEEKAKNAELKAAEKREKAEKLAAEKEAKRLERENKPTAWGLTTRAACANPTATIEEIIAIVAESGIDVEKSKSTIRTVYTDVHRVIKQLTANGFMK